MPFTNATVEILVGNVESRIVGAAPLERLDRALNGHLGPRSGNEGDVREAGRPQVLNPLDATFLTGSMRNVKRVLRSAGVRFRIRDLRFSGRAIHSWILGGCALRHYQEAVVAAATTASW